MKKIGLILILAVMFTACKTEKDYLVTIQTSYGDMQVILYDETPQHKANFIKLAESGRYDSTIFHRVIKGFMIQGGDVFTKEKLNQSDMYTVPAEFVADKIHRKGVLSAARMGDNVNPEKASSGCQFYIVQGMVWDKDQLLTDMRKLNQYLGTFITMESNQALADEYTKIYETGDKDALNDFIFSLKPKVETYYGIDLSLKKTPQQIETYTTVGGTPHLDGEYTVFGEVIKGLEVIDQIADQETGRADKPLQDIFMKMKVEQLSKAKITKEYGYQYEQK
ncbi:peptidylprolyl isomerase [Penaeicola halotolerans]|uniref:peptidylprolyl isomerase n=1 Tax=Penaeicola halotolerans TaxID=2793196 RepID=UPI001CF92C8F|nr:peptidylprolyl isomerase [Penaeicola halotolerans]